MSQTHSELTKESLIAELANKRYWHPFWPADFKLRALGALFCCEDGAPIYHGDEFWCFYEGQKESANLKHANAKFNYNDNEPRFATKEQAREAIKVYQWLNEVAA